MKKEIENRFVKVENRLGVLENAVSKTSLSKSGRIIMCIHCHHLWRTNSKYLTVSCPSCGGKTPNKAKNVNLSGEIADMKRKQKDSEYDEKMSKKSDKKAKKSNKVKTYTEDGVTYVKGHGIREVFAEDSDEQKSDDSDFNPFRGKRYKDYDSMEDKKKIFAGNNAKCEYCKKNLTKISQGYYEYNMLLCKKCYIRMEKSNYKAVSEMVKRL